MEDLVFEIKKNKKYKAIADEIVINEIENYKKSNPHWRNYRSEKIIKEIRAELHKKHSIFGFDNKKREKYFDELKNKFSFDLINKILVTNKSTRERIEIYDTVYKKIFEFTGNPKIILDLGAGLNPISIPYMQLEKLNYYSYDVNEEDKKFLNDFYKSLKINGLAEILDLTEIRNYEILPKSDVIFMFKFLDSVEKKGHKLAEDVIKTLINKTRFIVASFSSKTITGKNMNYPYRGWIERMLERIKLKFDRLEFDNEIFYIISK